MPARDPGEHMLLFERNNQEIDDEGNYTYPQPEIVDGRRMPTLYEVIEDDDFLPELRQNNALLVKYLTMERLLQLVQLITEMPEFNSDA